MGTKQNIIIALLIAIVIYGCIKKDTNKVNEEVTITGIIHGNEVSSTVPFSRFLNKHSQYYFFMLDEVEISGNKFQKKFVFDGSGIITIGPSRYVPKIYLICNRGDNILINIKNNKQGEKIVLFEGNNAEGNNKFHKRTRGSSLDKIIENNITIKKNNKDSTLTILKYTLNRLIKPYQELLEHDKISNSFFITAKSQIIADYLISLKRVLFHHLDNPSDLNLSSKMLKELLITFYTENDPFAEKFRSIDLVSRTIIADAKCQLIAKGFLKGEIIDIGLWSNDNRRYNYAPKELQEKIMAVNIMFNRFFEISNMSEDEKNFKKLKLEFPDSPYIIPLSKYFKSYDVKTVEPYSFGIYDLDEKNLKIIQHFENSDLKKIIQKIGQDKPIIVDLWATWCSPCVEEFSYSESLLEFTLINDIQILYVSVDSPRAGNRWMTNINKYQLIGSHFLATEEIYQYLEEELNFKNLSIPRYILFNKKGEVLDNNLPRPSSKNALFDRIESLLKKDSIF